MMQGSSSVLSLMVASWFLPFDKGYNDGAGNPPNPSGIMTDYLWKDILEKYMLAHIIENYAQVVEKVDQETKKKTYRMGENICKQCN